jgi:TetR/AcrR family transcriptional regulator
MYLRKKIMNTDDTKEFEPVFLAQWLETTRLYLFTGQEEIPDVEKPLLESLPESHGAQDRLISRVRGKLLRLVKFTAMRDQNPLQRLEHAFHFQILFISRHPDIPRRLLGWLSQGGEIRVRRRIQMAIGHYESRLCRMIAQAKQQGLIRADIEPRAAANLFVAMIQGLALRMHVDLRQHDLLQCEAIKVFAMYRAGLASSPK